MSLGSIAKAAVIPAVILGATYKLSLFKRVSNDSGLGYLVANAAATFGII